MHTRRTQSGCLRPHSTNHISVGPKRGSRFSNGVAGSENEVLGGSSPTRKLASGLEASFCNNVPGCVPKSLFVPSPNSFIFRRKIANYGAFRKELFLRGSYFAPEHARSHRLVSRLQDRRQWRVLEPALPLEIVDELGKLGELTLGYDRCLIVPSEDYCKTQTKLIGFKFIRWRPGRNFCKRVVLSLGFARNPGLLSAKLNREIFSSAI